MKNIDFLIKAIFKSFVIKQLIFRLVLQVPARINFSSACENTESNRATKF